MSVVSSAQQKVATALQQRRPAQAFVWGSNGEQLTPEQVASRRRVADALRHDSDYVPTGPWSLLGALAGEGVANFKQGEADEATKTGHAKVAAALTEARKSGDFSGVIGDDWATDAQRAEAGALQSRGWQQDDRQAEWSREDARYAQQRADAAAAASRPKWETFDDGTGNVYRYNANDPNSSPSLFFDGPDKPGFRPMTPEEKASYGLPATSAAQIGPDGKVDTLGGASPLVTVNTGENSSAFDKKADELAAGRFDQIVQDGSSAQAFTGDLQTLTGLARGLKTGKEAEIMSAIGPYAQALGVNVEGLGSAQAYDAIVSRMAPAMRLPGAGASSDFDAKQFLKSLPSLGNTPEGNALIVQTMQNIQSWKMKARDIALTALNHQKTWQDADKEIQALGNPYQAFTESQARQRQSGGVDLTAPAPPASWTGDPSLWEFLTPEERGLWQ